MGDLTYMLNTKTILLVLLSLFLSACGQQSTPSGDPIAGETLFCQVTIDSAPGCASCHSTQADKVLIGPSLAGIANRAGERVPDQSAEEYLQNSILDPNLYVVDGFSAGLMYQKYKDVLKDEQVRDLVAYLSTLK
jgi:nitric oxide reductase subunit C